MSTKKDKFNKKDNFYMNLAFNLARERIGLTGENPSVGCIIVKNDEIIGIGKTGINGRPHAERNAIKILQNKIKHLHNVASVLLSKETITGLEMDDIVKNGIPEPKESNPKRKRRTSS